MARFDTKGLDDLTEDLKQMGELAGDLADEMLLGAAEVVKQSWREAMQRHGVKLTGQTMDSIGFAKKPKLIGHVKTIDIYPQGYSTYTEADGKRYRRKNRVRNAEVAFIAHYGTSKRPGTRFVDTADDLSGQRVVPKMAEIRDNFLKKRGF